MKQHKLLHLNKNRTNGGSNNGRGGGAGEETAVGVITAGLTTATSLTNNTTHETQSNLTTERVFTTSLSASFFYFYDIFSHLGRD